MKSERASGSRPLFGVNACYFQGDYGHDLAPNPRFVDWPCSFDPMHIYRPLIEAKALGLDAVRVWLCENSEGILLDDDGHIVGVHESLLTAIDVLQEGAALNGVRLYLTLLDGNAWARERDPVTRAILSDTDATARFAEHVAAPIARRLDPELMVALELVSEPETATAACMKDTDLESIEWSAIGGSLVKLGDAARSEGELLVTAGTMHIFLPELLAADPKLTAIDIHVYHGGGGLPSRQELATYAKDERILDRAFPLIGGELGVPDEATSPTALTNYLHNAQSLDYDAAFLWQLEGDLVQKDELRRPFTSLAQEVADTVTQLRTKS